MTVHDYVSPSQAAPTETPEISNETLSRCAQLLATGEIGWPAGLSDEQELDLVEKVRCYRRAKLVQFIASRIAADIARESEAE